MNDTPSSRLRDQWLDALLPAIPFDGWSEIAARRAADEAGLSTDERALAAPRGVIDLLDAFFDRAEDALLAEMASADTSEMRVRDKVAAGLRAWLNALEPHKEAVRRAAARGLTPWGAGGALQRTWSVADAVWTGAGDEARDYNRYTKRGLLAAIVPAVTTYWLNQDDPDKVDAFMQRRLDRAMKLGQAGGRILGPLLDAIGRRKT